MKPHHILTLGLASVTQVAAPTAQARAVSEATLVIHAPLPRVWALVTGVNDWPHWNAKVESAHLAGPVARGSVFKWRSGGLSVTSTFQDVQPMTRLTWTGVTLGTRAVHSWTFVEKPDGIVVTTREAFDGWLPALAPRMMQKMLDDTLPALLGSLKTAAEAVR